jgi:signal peptidase I
MFINYYFSFYLYILFFGQEFSELNFINTCKTEEINYVINGNSMLPLYKNNQKVLVAKNYYDECKISPKKNDIIVLLYNNKFLVKKIFALENDIITVKKNKLFVNNKIIVNSNNQPYNIKEKKIYMEKPIPKNYIFVLGDNILESKDSRNIGLIPIRDIKGFLLK